MHPRIKESAKQLRQDSAFLRKKIGMPDSLLDEDRMLALGRAYRSDLKTRARPYASHDLAMHYVKRHILKTLQGTLHLDGKELAALSAAIGRVGVNAPGQDYESRINGILLLEQLPGQRGESIFKSWKNQVNALAKINKNRIILNLEGIGRQVPMSFRGNRQQISARLLAASSNYPDLFSSTLKRMAILHKSTGDLNAYKLALIAARDNAQSKSRGLAARA